MSIKSRLFSRTLAATFFGVVPLVCMAEAQVASHSKDIVVVLPGSLPELAQRHGIAFQLYSGSGDGSCYLYIEQHQGERLLVLNVTDPGQVILTEAVPLTVPGPFDFVRMVGSSAYLVRFRNGLGMGILDLRKPKAPVLKLVKNLQNPGRSESLGDTAFLMTSGRPTHIPAVSEDYQVFDSTDPANPSLLVTVKQVNGEIARDETGTTFLLGADGLTIIRHPRVEERYKLAQSSTN